MPRLRARVEAAVDVARMRVGADRLPVLAHHVPLHGRQAQFCGGAQDSRAARAVGWAEVADRRAEGIFEGRLQARELFADDARGLPCEPGMRLRVVADQVPGGVDAADELRALADEAADHEEGRARVVGGQHLEQRFGGGVVGAVVVGQRGFVGVVAGDECVAEELRAGAERGVGEGRGGVASAMRRRGERFGRRHEADSLRE